MLFVVFGLAALLPVCLSQCYTAELMAHVMFIDADRDGDGVLHLVEMINVFEAYDANHDGRISRHEYMDHQTRLDPSVHDMAHALYDTYDIDGDNHLDLGDYVHFYLAMDSDGDDNVSESEFRVYWTKLFTDVRHHSHLIC